MRIIATLTVLLFLASNSALAEKGRVVADDSKASVEKKSAADDRIRLGYVGDDVPAILSESDVKVYKKLFRLQRKSQRSQVASLVPKLQNRELMGHLIAERLLHPRTRAPYKDLKKWLSRYGDHSMAPTIYKLAKKRQPRSDKYGPKKPDYVKASVAKYSDPDQVSKESIKNSSKRRALLKKLKRYRQKQYYSKAIIALSKKHNKELLGEDTWAQVTLKLARAVFNYGDYKRPARLANMVVNQTEARRSEALWMMGFSYYKQGEKERAASAFRRLAYGVPHNSRYFAKAGYWAGRSYEDLGRDSMARVFYNLSAQDMDAFYGQISAEKVAKDRIWAWDEPRVADKDKQFLFTDPLVRRVIALAQIGEHGLAQKELKLIHARVPYDMDESLLALASQLKLPNIQLTLARNLREREQTYFSGLYPEPAAWKPRGGYRIDKALMHAIMRQESAFKPEIKSRAGARGLMQVMPNTAKYIRRKHNRPVFSRHALLSPEINMALGQDYLEYLMTNLDGNMIQVVAAYNAGPGNVRKWLKKDIGQGDPLVFIESIPFRETRKYVQYVLANLWMYQHRYKDGNVGLNVLAQNDWPVYKDFTAVSFKK